RAMEWLGSSFLRTRDSSHRPRRALRPSQAAQRRPMPTRARKQTRSTANEALATILPKVRRRWDPKKRPAGRSTPGAVGSGSGLPDLGRCRFGSGFREAELNLAILEVHGHLAAVDQAAEEELVGQRLADGVLDETGHRPRAHLRIEALHRQELLQRLREVGV